MQLLSNIANLFTRSPPSTERRPDHNTRPNTLASYGIEEVEDPEAESGIRTNSALADVVGRNSNPLSRGRLDTHPADGSDMRPGVGAASDERRLFPTYGKSHDDVPITPGQTFRNTPKARVQKHAIFRPIDRITQRGRDSGPVRAYGVPVTNGTTQRSLSSRHPLRSPSLVDDEDQALKRQRLSAEQFIDLVAEDDVHQAQSKGLHRHRTPSVASVELVDEIDTRLNAPSVLQAHIDNGIEKEPVEAKSTRLPNLVQSEHGCSAPSQHITKHTKLPQQRHDPQNSGLTIEVDDNDTSAPAVNKRSKSLETRQKQNEIRHDSDGSESPDELQGEVTVRKYPGSSNFQKKTINALGSTGKVPRGLSRRLSPNDIRPTVFSSSNKTPDRRQHRSKGAIRSHQRHFEVKFFRYGDTEIEDRNMRLVLDEGNDIIGLLAPNETLSSASIPLHRIVSMQLGTEGNMKCRFRLSKTEGSNSQNFLDVEFETSQDKDDLRTLLIKKGVNHQQRPAEWMDKAFDKVIKPEPRRGKRPSTPDIPEAAEDVKPEPSKRQKLSASLEGEGEGEILKGIKQPPRRVPLPVTQSSSGVLDSVRPTKHDEETVIPVKTYQSPLRGRETRSKARQGLVELVDDESISPQKNIPSRDGTWSRPLVYPREGKKKAEVDSHDLERLRDGEFLNDNLIGLYLRFLEHHLERNKPEVSKRIYFFNSYFFASLTNTRKGKKGVNYEAVQKWTRNVDLFSHDYVVVPINESAHWYLAIICNLSTLRKREMNIKSSASQKKVSQLETTTTDEIPETPPANEVSTPEETARGSLASMNLSEEALKPHDIQESEDEWPETEENQVTPPTIFRNEVAAEAFDTKATKSLEKGKKTKRTGMVYSIDQPTIITFDSLGAARQPAIRVLRAYLMEEADAKQSLDLDTKDIKGMTAKEIPLQPNYSDCGLYLLAYLEKFVQDPDTFIRKLLQREMSAEDDWPSMKSGLLRRRLRDFLFKLHEEQEDFQDTGLVDAQPISYILGPPIVESAEDQDEPEATLDAEPEVISDSFQDQTKANDDPALTYDSSGEAVVRETQLSQNQDPATAGIHRHEKKADEGSSEDQLAKEPQWGGSIQLPQTPERAMASNPKVVSPVDLSSPKAFSKSAEREVPSRSDQTRRDIFDDMFEFLNKEAVRPRGTVEVQIPTVQVPRTPPPAKKTGKERTSPRQKKSKKKDL